MEEDIKKRRASILKPQKTRNPFAEVEPTDSYVENTPTARLKRVSFKRISFVKPFILDSDEKTTIWDNTYEEEVPHTDSSHSLGKSSSQSDGTCAEEPDPQYDFNTTHFELDEENVDRPTVWEEQGRDEIQMDRTVYLNRTMEFTQAAFLYNANTVRTNTTILNNTSSMDLTMLPLVDKENIAIDGKDLKNKVSILSFAKRAKPVDNRTSINLNKTVNFIESDDGMELTTNIPTKIFSTKYTDKLNPNVPRNIACASNRSNINITSNKTVNFNEADDGMELTTNIPAVIFSSDYADVINPNVSKNMAYGVTSAMNKSNLGIASNKTVNFNVSDDGMELTTNIPAKIFSSKHTNMSNPNVPINMACGVTSVVNKSNLGITSNKTVNFNESDDGMELTTNIPAKIFSSKRTDKSNPNVSKNMACGVTSAVNKSNLGIASNKTVNFNESDDGMELTTNIPAKIFSSKQTDMSNPNVSKNMACGVKSVVNRSNLNIASNKTFNLNESNDVMELTTNIPATIFTSEYTNTLSSGKRYDLNVSSAINRSHINTISNKTVNFNELDAGMEFTRNIPATIISSEGANKFNSSRNQNFNVSKNISCNIDGGINRSNYSVNPTRIDNLNKSDDAMEFTRNIPGIILTSEGINKFNISRSQVKNTRSCESGDDIVPEEYNLDKSDDAMEFTRNIPGVILTSEGINKFNISRSKVTNMHSCKSGDIVPEKYNLDKSDDAMEFTRNIPSLTQSSEGLNKFSSSRNEIVNISRNKVFNESDAIIVSEDMEMSCCELPQASPEVLHSPKNSDVNKHANLSHWRGKEAEILNGSDKENIRIQDCSENINNPNKHHLLDDKDYHIAAKRARLNENTNNTIASNKSNDQMEFTKTIPTKIITSQDLNKLNDNKYIHLEASYKINVEDMEMSCRDSPKMPLNTSNMSKSKDISTHAKCSEKTNVATSDTRRLSDESIICGIVGMNLDKSANSSCLKDNIINNASKTPDNERKNNTKTLNNTSMNLASLPSADKENVLTEKVEGTTILDIPDKEKFIDNRLTMKATVNTSNTTDFNLSDGIEFTNDISGILLMPDVNKSKDNINSDILSSSDKENITISDCSEKIVANSNIQSFLDEKTDSNKNTDGKENAENCSKNVQEFVIRDSDKDKNNISISNKQISLYKSASFNKDDLDRNSSVKENNVNKILEHPSTFTAIRLFNNDTLKDEGSFFCGLNSFKDIPEITVNITNVNISSLPSFQNLKSMSPCVDSTQQLINYTFGAQRIQVPQLSELEQLDDTKFESTCPSVLSHTATKEEQSITSPDEQAYITEGDENDSKLSNQSVEKMRKPVIEELHVAEVKTKRDNIISKRDNSNIERKLNVDSSTSKTTIRPESQSCSKEIINVSDKTSVINILDSPDFKGFKNNEVVTIQHRTDSCKDDQNIDEEKAIGIFDRISNYSNDATRNNLTVNISQESFLESLDLDSSCLIDVCKVDISKDIPSNNELRHILENIDTQFKEVQFADIQFEEHFSIYDVEFRFDQIERKLNCLKLKPSKILSLKEFCDTMKMNESSEGSVDVHDDKEVENSHITLTDIEIPQKPVSLLEKIQEIEQRCTPHWRFEKEEDNKYYFSTLYNTLKLVLQLNDESVWDIQMYKHLLDIAPPISHYVLRLFMEALDNKHLEAALGIRYTILSFLDYLYITMQSMLDFITDFSEMKMKMDPVNIVTFKILNIELILNWVVRIDVTDLKNINPDNVSIEIKTCSYLKQSSVSYEDAVKNLVNTCPKGLGFLKCFRQKIDEYIEILSKRRKFAQRK